MQTVYLPGTGHTAVLLILLLFLGGHSSAFGNQGELVPLTARYSASMNKGVSISGSATRSLVRQDDGTWLYRSTVDSFIADIRESLVLRWENNRVIPLRYRYKLSGFLITNREHAIDFNWNTQTASVHYRGRKFTLDLKDHALDPMGYQLQLHQDLKAGKTDMTYHVIDRGRYDEDRFAVVGEEMLQTRDGKVRTLKVEKMRSEDSKRETLMWFAPHREYLLMRLLQVEPDGSRYEITIDEAEIKR